MRDICESSFSCSRSSYAAHGEDIIIVILLPASQVVSLPCKIHSTGERNEKKKNINLINYNINLICSPGLPAQHGNDTTSRSALLPLGDSTPQNVTTYTLQYHHVTAYQSTLYHLFQIGSG